LDPPPCHAGLDDVVLALQLGAVSAVALLQTTGGPVDTGPHRDGAMGQAGLRDDVPQPRALLDGHVQLPAEIADVGDPAGDDRERTDLDLPPVGEGEAL